ncbi:hypothetical protein F5Y10DRAFT_278130 [Nemania abortiva]|nr:hypothetical protein F5Y10DRAFT_278130 [Nemania abortiva]
MYSPPLRPFFSLCNFTETNKEYDIRFDASYGFFDLCFLSTPALDDNMQEENGRGPADDVLETSHLTRRGIFTQRPENLAVPTHVDELLRLKKPVQWNPPDMNDLQRRMMGDTGAEPPLLLSLINHLNSQYIPHEARELVKRVSLLGSTSDFLFADADATAGNLSLSQIDFITQPLGNASDSLQRAQAAKRLAVLNEYTHLSLIVARTIDYSTLSRSDAAWNEKVYGPMLNLAALHAPDVAVENTTGASIDRRFIPSSVATYNGKLDGGTVDYVLALRPESKRLQDFISNLDHPLFNQTNYPPLRIWPTGVFVKIRAMDHDQSVAEAMIQLSIWVASWFNRISSFPENTPSSSSSKRSPPFIPILLVDRGSWDVYFVFDDQSRYNICGPMDMGDTKTVKNAYRLLAGLRDLVNWMATDFHAWVDSCL